MPASGFADRLVRRYQGQPLLRALAQLIPLGIGSALDTALATHYSNIQQSRLQSLFDELGRGNIALTPALIESEDFLHCYFAALRATVNTRRREKIHLFARLLAGAAKYDDIASVDAFEEYLALLEDLSYRELILLSILDRLQASHPHLPEENDLQRTLRFWGEFETAAADAGIRLGDLDAMMLRLARTGCFETYQGRYYSDTGGKGKLTSMYFNLKQAVGMLGSHDPEYGYPRGNR